MDVAGGCIDPYSLFSIGLSVANYLSVRALNYYSNANVETFETAIAVFINSTFLDLHALKCSLKRPLVLRRSRGIRKFDHHVAANCGFAQPWFGKINPCPYKTTTVNDGQGFITRNS